MHGGLIVALALVAADPGPASPPAPAPDDLQAYDRFRREAGRDPDTQVRLALWCEAHELQAERLKHLVLAVLADPKNATARGLMGLVAYRGKWQKPEAVSDAVGKDEALAAAMAEYNAKRAAIKDTAEAHWKLALWCERNGLGPEAMAHFSTVVRLDPGREGAWKRLGFKKHGGRWVSEAKIAEAKAEAARQEKADRHWKPLLEKWRGQLKSKGKRAEAEKALLGVTDPRAVRAVWQVFAKGPVPHQELAVQLLGQIDASSSSKALASLALSGGSAEVRRKATESLKGRDPREFAGVLIAMLLDPVQYEVRPVGGPGSPGAVFVKGERFNVQRLYSPPPAPFVPFFPGDFVLLDGDGLPVIFRQESAINTMATGRITGDRLLTEIQADQRLAASLPGLAQDVFRDLAAGNTQSLPRLAQAHQAVQVDPFLNYGAPNGPIPFMPADVRQNLAEAIRQTAATENKTPDQFGFGLTAAITVETRIPIGRMMQEAQKAALVSQAQLKSDVAALDAYNAGVRANNQRIEAVLTQATGEGAGKDREGWKAWWVNQLGYAYRTPDPAPVPTFVEDVPLGYMPQPVPIVTTTVASVTGFTRISCFGAGTPVRTLSGLRPIESLEIGDRVLTQDIKSGALRYRPILVVHRNPPSPTFRVAMGDEAIVSSHFHRFWKAGRGWVMARDLKEGDTLRTIDGLSRVTSIESGNVQPVFNLDVADDADFFVGQRGVLVHDNTLPDLRLVPFDAPSTPATADRRGGSAP